MSDTQNNLMQTMLQNSYLSGGEDYIETLYESYLKDPYSVSEQWQQFFLSIKANNVAEISHADLRDYFLQLAKQNHVVAAVSGDVEQERKQTQVNELIYAYRALGHFQARLDPLGLAPNPVVPELDINHYHFSQADLNAEFIPDHIRDAKPTALKDIVTFLQNTYCKTIGAEFTHITNQQEVHWIEQRLEDPALRPAIAIEKQRRILAGLTAAEGLEKYLGSKYVGQKRFSLEGGDSLIPLLDELIQRAGAQQTEEIVIGMAHRGRLNVLVNILGKAPQELFDEFEGKIIDELRSGDVKYHQGFSSDIQTPGGAVHLALAFNPSHLEIISPVVIGSVFSRQQRRQQDSRKSVLAVQIHGDAAFAGQGVVMETFALSQTTGYGTGGTVHIVVNNQVGFTTDPINARSTFYCTDIAKMIQAPIFHVNADDPEAVIFITQLALDYRMAFGKDVVIDLICYRRHGHNEADEPSATQPLMYQKIKQQATVRQLYADQLIQAGKIPAADADTEVAKYRDALDAGKTILPALTENHNNFTIDWSPYLDQPLTTKVNTGVDATVLNKLATIMNTLPANSTLQPQVAKVIEDQRKMTAGELALNWGYAECLAYATILNDGFDIRLSGQDCGRGTFAHRHAKLHDYKNGNIYVPLTQVSDKKHFTVIDSVLSEEAVLAFEYGYASASPQTLVLWEAQFGDFANGAQVVIDQFISSGEQKWGRLCGLVMLLPHGYEGMGPEHSSARLERFLQLCAQDNIQVCVPTTPAQVFHMLRRQVLRPARKPLIVMTPKSLLRHKLAVSSLADLATGQFQNVLAEVDALKANDVQSVILCSGKVYYDLLEARRESQLTQAAIIRVEQLYPFPITELRTIIAEYKKAKTIIWCQEEPENQGAWLSIKSSLEKCLQKGQALHYVGRASAAAPAVGSSKLHTKQQNMLIDQALKGNP